MRWPSWRLWPAKCPSKTGAPGGTSSDASQHLTRVAPKGFEGSPRASRWVASASYLEVDRVGGGHRGRGRGGCHRVLRGTHRQHPLLLRHPGRPPGPNPGGEGGFVGSASPARPWACPSSRFRCPPGGLLVFRFAPEAEGHGTDAAISAVHHNPRGVRFRAVIVKIVASALTIGSGGSGGREGPTGQISAGFGSLLARVLDLEPLDGRIAVATGVGSGIGAIFGAPLGGAVLAAGSPTATTSSRPRCCRASSRRPSASWCSARLRVQAAVRLTDSYHSLIRPN